MNHVLLCAWVKPAFLETLETWAEEQGVSLGEALEQLVVTQGETACKTTKSISTPVVDFALAPLDGLQKLMTEEALSVIARHLGIDDTNPNLIREIQCSLKSRFHLTL